MASRPPRQAPRALLALARRALSRPSGVPRGDALVRAAALRVLERSERVVDRLDRVARTMERVADVELALMERLVPIVEDLGELVSLSVLEARRRLGGRPRAPAAPGDARDDGAVIDVEARPAP